MMGLGEIMGVGASIRARGICERVVLLIAGFLQVYFWASFCIVGILLNVFCRGGNLLFFFAWTLETEFLLDFDRGLLFFFCLDSLKSNFSWIAQGSDGLPILIERFARCFFFLFNHTRIQPTYIDCGGNFIQFLSAEVGLDGSTPAPLGSPGAIRPREPSISNLLRTLRR